MAGNSSECFPVPSFVKTSFGCLLSPDDDLESIFDELNYCFDPDTKNSIWSKTVVQAKASQSSSLELLLLSKLSKSDGETRTLTIPGNERSVLRTCTRNNSGNLMDNSLSPIVCNTSSNNENSFSQKITRKEYRRRPIQRKSLFYSTVIEEPYENCSLHEETPVPDNSCNMFSEILPLKRKSSKQHVNCNAKTQIPKKLLSSDSRNIRMRENSLGEKMLCDSVGNISLRKSDLKRRVIENSTSEVDHNRTSKKNLTSKTIETEKKLKHSRTKLSSPKKQKGLIVENENPLSNTPLKISPVAANRKSYNDLTFNTYDKTLWKKQFDVFLMNARK